MIDRFVHEGEEYVAMPCDVASCAGCAFLDKQCEEVDTPECWEVNKNESKYYVFKMVPQEQS